MLSYLGWRLHSEETGELDRHKGWRERYSSVMAPPSNASATSLTSDVVLPALLTFLLGMRLVTFANRLVLFLVDEAKAGRLTHLVLPPESILRTFLLPVITTSLYLEAPVMAEEERDRVEAAVLKMVNNDSDSE